MGKEAQILRESMKHVTPHLGKRFGPRHEENISGRVADRLHQDAERLQREILGRRPVSPVVPPTEV